jgi:hypothetical protein
MAFATNNMCKKQVVYLIFNVIWRLMYVNYQVKCLDFMFMEEALEEHLCDTLKELKMKNYNEEGLEMATLQSDQMLDGLKATNGYASRNVF